MKTRRCNVNDDALRLVHVPDVHVPVFILSANLGIPTTIIHDLQFPACREVPRDYFYAFLQMQPLQVSNYEERATPDAVDDKTPTAVVDGSWIRATTSSSCNRGERKEIKKLSPAGSPVHCP